MPSIKLEDAEFVGDYIDQLIQKYMEVHPSADKSHLIEFVKPIQFGIENLLQKQKNLRNYFLTITGEEPMDVLFGLEKLRNEYSLVNQGEDGFVFPLMSIIENRLEELDSLKEENKKLRDELEKFSCIKHPIQSFETYCQIKDKLKEFETERNYYKYLYENED